MTPSLFQAFRRVAQNGEWRGWGCGKQKKGERREDEGYFTLSPFPHHLAVFSCSFYLARPHKLNILSVARLSVSAHEQKRRACKEKPSERAKKGGRKVVLAQLFSLRSSYYLTA